MRLLLFVLFSVNVLIKMSLYRNIIYRFIAKLIIQHLWGLLVCKIHYVWHLWSKIN